VSSGIYQLPRCTSCVPRSLQILLCTRLSRDWVLVASSVQLSPVTLVYQVRPTLLEWRCSDVSVIGTIISRKMHILFVLSILVSDLTCVLATPIIGDKLVFVHRDISTTFFRFTSENNFAQICATKYQIYLENQLNNLWTWNNSMLMKYRTVVLYSSQDILTSITVRIPTNSGTQLTLRSSRA
jgi:hypothetical protein